MPLPAGHWYIDIEKMLEGEYWTNRYVVAAGSLADAVTAGTTIVAAERAVTAQAVLFTKVRASDDNPFTDVYQITALNQFGLWVENRLALLALFNVSRVDFTTAGGGRPSRKYLRGTLADGNTESGKLIPAQVTALEQNYIAPLVAMAAFVDVDGQAITAGTVYPYVGMRQLRRGSKKKATPSSGGTPA